MDNLSNYSLNADPFKSFDSWYQAALKVEQNAQAMSVATYDQKRNRPNSRYLLYKGMKESNFTFYTNYLSPKSDELEHNSEISLTFYWHVSKKQVRIHGRVKKMSAEESKAYFHSRDRESQLASFISHQSSVVEDKETLLKRLNEAKIKYEGLEIPMPAHWGGYLVEAYEMEFFLYGDHRLNDRFHYENKNGTWIVTRLEP